MRAYMIKFLLLVLLCSGTVLAQSGAAGTVKQLSNALSQSQELQSNVRLRFQVLALEMDTVAKRKDVSDILRFFSDTRVMVWNRPVSPEVEQNMVNLEQNMVAIAQEKGRSLDLPPVGYSRAGGGGGGARIVTGERVTAGGLSSHVLLTEQLATELLQANSSAELLFLRDNLTRLRQDLEDNSVASDTVRSVLGSRARFLAGDAAAISDARFSQQLNILGEILRANFPPSRLRSTKGQQIRI